MRTPRSRFPPRQNRARGLHDFVYAALGNPTMHLCRRLAVLLLMPLLQATALRDAAADAKVGEAVPEIEFGPLLHGDGRTRLSEFRGQPVVVIEWVASSENCWNYAIPKARELHGKYAASGLVVILTEGELTGAVDLQAVLLRGAPGLAVRAGGRADLRVAWSEQAFLPRFAVIDAEGKLAGEGLIHTRAKLVDDLARDLSKACAKAGRGTPGQRCERAEREFDYLLAEGEFGAAQDRIEALGKELAGEPAVADRVAALARRLSEPDATAERLLDAKVAAILKPLQGKRPKGGEAKKLRELAGAAPSQSRVGARALRLAEAIEKAVAK